MATASTEKTQMVRVFLINHGYYMGREFTALSLALAYARTKSAEVAFHQGGDVIAAWSPIGGLTLYRDFGPLVTNLLRSVAA